MSRHWAVVVKERSAKAESAPWVATPTALPVQRKRGSQRYRRAGPMSSQLDSDVNSNRHFLNHFLKRDQPQYQISGVVGVRSTSVVT